MRIPTICIRGVKKIKLWGKTKEFPEIFAVGRANSGGRRSSSSPLLPSQPMVSGLETTLQWKPKDAVPTASQKKVRPYSLGSHFLTFFHRAGFATKTMQVNIFYILPSSSLSFILRIKVFRVYRFHHELGTLINMDYIIMKHLGVSLLVRWCDFVEGGWAQNYLDQVWRLNLPLSWVEELYTHS